MLKIKSNSLSRLKIGFCLVVGDIGRCPPRVTASVRSVVPLLLHQNGLGICRMIVCDNVWSCEDCVYEFEHTIYLPAHQLADLTRQQFRRRFRRFG